jgi:alanyl-tRNA synthetase
MFKFNNIKMDEAGNDGGKGGAGGAGDDALKALQGKLDTLQKQFDDSQADNQRLTAKIGEANKHAKKAEKEAADKAKANATASQDYEQLFKSSEAERVASDERYDSLVANTAKKEEKIAALKMAGELSEGVNAELLSDYIARRLKYTEDGIKVLDETGNLTVSTPDQLKTEFSGSARFGSLLKGNQSSGGGASGGANGGGTTGKTISRADFDALDATARMKHVKDGGKIID